MLTVALFVGSFSKSVTSRIPSKYSYIIDMEIFIDNRGSYLPKDIIVVCSTGGYSDHWILDQPYMGPNLTDAARLENKWLTQSTHGLKWKEGNIPYTGHLRDCVSFL